MGLCPRLVSRKQLSIIRVNKGNVKILNTTYSALPCGSTCGYQVRKSICLTYTSAAQSLIFSLAAPFLTAITSSLGLRNRGE